MTKEELAKHITKFIMDEWVRKQIDVQTTGEGRSILKHSSNTIHTVIYQLLSDYERN